MNFINVVLRFPVPSTRQQCQGHTSYTWSYSASKCGRRGNVRSDHVSRLCKRAAFTDCPRLLLEQLSFYSTLSLYLGACDLCLEHVACRLPCCCLLLTACHCLPLLDVLLLLGAPCECRSVQNLQSNGRGLLRLAEPDETCCRPCSEVKRIRLLQQAAWFCFYQDNKQLIAAFLRHAGPMLCSGSSGQPRTFFAAGMAIAGPWC